VVVGRVGPLRCTGKASGIDFFLSTMACRRRGVQEWPSPGIDKQVDEELVVVVSIFVIDHGMSPIYVVFAYYQQ
jgi:hypothetical protein